MVCERFDSGSLDNELKPIISKSEPDNFEIVVTPAPR